MSLNDLILFIVIFGSTSIAVVFPEIGVWFEPSILYFMMFVLFLSFMKSILAFSWIPRQRHF